MNAQRRQFGVIGLGQMDDSLAPAACENGSSLEHQQSQVSGTYLESPS